MNYKFVDAFYNQIKMHSDDEESTMFITSQGLYYYWVKPFGLQNVRVTYQWLVDKLFKKLLGNKMKVYVDNMLTKSLQAKDHVNHLWEMFEILRTYQMKLKLEKCAFGVSLRKFLGFVVN